MPKESTVGIVVKVHKCWWIKVNTKPIRNYALDGALFPHIITVQYKVGERIYTKKKFLHYNIICPDVNDKIDVYYDKEKPTKICLNL